MMQSQSSKLSVRYGILAAALGGAMLAPRAASAALETRTWIGGTDSGWNTNDNWSPASAPRSSDRIAVFDRVSTYQPAVQTSVTVVAGVRMTGDTVGDVTITSSGAVTFQTDGTTLNGTDGVGVLIDNTSSGTLNINTTSFKAGNTESWINNSGNLFTIGAPVNLNGKTVTITGSGSTLISGAIATSSGTGALTKEGNGTLTLSNATSTYNGTTTISAGTLLVNGSLSSSSAVVTANGGTLGGTGSILRDTTINAGATIAPGTADDTAGLLTINRSLTLGGMAAFDLIAPASHDAVSVNSSNSSGRTLSFDGSLVVDAQPGLTFAAGQTYDLFDWGAKTTVSGTFTSIQLPTLGGGLSWELFGGQPFDYTTGQISVVPEPLSISLMGLAGAALMMRRRRHG
jgi:autotransporter-associated beta strand protein